MSNDTSTQFDEVSREEKRAVAGRRESLAGARVKTLSVRQPWASLIASGRKTIELRSWSTKYRGPIRIISGAAKWRGETSYPDGPRGVTLCEAELVDVRLATPEDTDAAGLQPPDGWFAWVLSDARPIAQTPIKGRLGLYES